MIRIWIGSVSKCITCYPGCKSFSIVWQWFTPKQMAFYDGHFSKTERINTDFTWCRTLTNVIFQLFLFFLLRSFKLQFYVKYVKRMKLVSKIGKFVHNLWCKCPALLKLAMRVARRHRYNLFAELITCLCVVCFVCTVHMRRKSVCEPKRKRKSNRVRAESENKESKRKKHSQAAQWSVSVLHRT